MSRRMSQHEIAKKLGISKHAVQVKQKKHTDFESIFDMKKTSRLSKLDKRDKKKQKN